MLSGYTCACKALGEDVSVLVNDGVALSQGAPRKLKVYFSLGSCEKVGRRDLEWVARLAACPYDFVVDRRWAHLFPTGVETHGYKEHASFLGAFDVVVHHGGAGVVFTCLEVGVWQCVVPQVGDQFEWRNFVSITGCDAGLDMGRWTPLAGTSPGRFPRTRPKPLPIESTGRYFKLHHWLDTDCPRLAARDCYERACQSEERFGDFWCEVWWTVSGYKPPHYEFQYPGDLVQRAWAALTAKYGTEEDNILERIGKAIFSEIGFDSTWSVIRQAPFRNIFTGGASTYWKYLNLLRDAMRHYNTFALEMGVDVGVKFPEPLPEVEFTSIIPTFLGLPRGLRTTKEFDTLRRELDPANLQVYLRELKTPLLGLNFGLFHAVVWFNGHWYELQRVGPGKNLLCKWNSAPFTDWSSPVQRVISVPVPKGADVRFRDMAAILDGTQYRAAGDNCLFLANLMVYLATGKVLPWELFGFYGVDLPTTLGAAFSKYVEGVLCPGKHDERWDIPSLERGPANLAKMVDFYGGQLPGCEPRGSKLIGMHYGKPEYDAVHEFLADPTVQACKGLLTSEGVLPRLVEHARTKFALNSLVIHRALEWTSGRKLKLAGDELALLVAIGKRLQHLGTSPLAAQVTSAALETKRWWGVKPRQKVVWAPLAQFSTPHHWLYSPEGGTFKSTMRPSDDVSLPARAYSTVLDLKGVLSRYERIFPEVAFPEIRMIKVSPGEWQLETKVPIRKFTKELEHEDQRLVQDLLEATGGQAGVYSMRYATEDMAEQVTDRYFTGVPEGLLSEERKDELAAAIFAANPSKYSDMKLASPEDVFKKWHTSYSAGFPYRFNARGNAKRADLMHAAGGKRKFLAAVRAYIAEPAKFPTVSHAFVKDEVLPIRSKEVGKVRTIMAQDLLSYFNQMTVEGDLDKRLDPASFSAVGISVQHGGLSELASQHTKFKHHYASDITALDSRLSRDYLDVCTRVRKMGFANHPQREAAEHMLDVAAENLYTSWVIDIHTGRARLKRQGASTGHASTTPTNSLYVEAMFLDAWLTQTPYTAEQFYEMVKTSTYSDDNMYSTDLPREVFGPEVLQNHLAKMGVHLKLEAEGDSIDSIPFLAKQFSTREDDIAHVVDTIGHKPKVCVYHDRKRLVMKFSDIKGRSTLLTRWDRAASFLENCAHHKDLHAQVWEYMHRDLLPRMEKRKALRDWVRKRRPATYEAVMELQYLEKHQVPLIPTPAAGLWDSVVAKFDEIRMEIIAWDGTLNTFSRLLERWSALLHITGLEGEKTGYDVSDLAKAHLDPEFTLERHLYVHSGCPDNLATLKNFRNMSPFGQFLRLEEFFERRGQWVYRECDKTTLNLQVGGLMSIYTLVAVMEQQLERVPILGPAYKFATRMKMLTAEAYANLNALNYTLFGKSSAALGALIPKDSKEHLKYLAISLWAKFAHLAPECGEVNWESLENVSREWLAVVGMVHSITWEGQLWSLAPAVESASNPSQHTFKVDHSVQVDAALACLERGEVPLVSGPTGSGKSTAFISQLKQRVDTVYLSLPRRILVDTNPVVTTRCHANSTDRLTRGTINGVTHGYLRLALAKLGAGEVLVLDEFHELDEDALCLLKEHRGKVILVTATPKKGGIPWVEIPLTSRMNEGYSVSKVLRKKPGLLADRVVATVREERGKKAMVIHPSKKGCDQIAKALAAQVPGLRTHVIWKGDTSVPQVDVYVCTSVVDAGITIPDVELVIDTGLSVGRKLGRFGTWDSSRTTMEQRAGRTGRTCSGKYIRLSTKFDETKFDFSVAFGCNERDLAVAYGETRKFPSFAGAVPYLPGLYNELVYSQNFSGCVYWYCRTQTTSLLEARTLYASMRHNPRNAEWSFLFESYGYPSLQEWHNIDHAMSLWSCEGKNWVDPTTGELTLLEWVSEAGPNRPAYGAVPQKWHTPVFLRGCA